MATAASFSHDSGQPAEPVQIGPYLAPVDKPNGPLLKLLYRLMRRRFGKVPGWLTVFSARMSLALTNWIGKMSQLHEKLELSSDTAILIRERVASANMCTWCMDATRWFATNKAPLNLPKFDALHEYQTSPLFSDQERAALASATELTEHKHVSPETFAALSHHYSERQICEIVGLVSSEHLYDINNLGLGIGSDWLCEISRPNAAGSRASSPLTRETRP